MPDLGPRRFRIVNGAASPIETGPQGAGSRIVRGIIPVLCSISAASLLGFYLAARFQPLLDRQEEGIDSFRAVAGIQRIESALLRRWIEGAPESIVLAGDFNLTAEHSLFRRDWSGYRDAFTWTSWGLGHTMFTRQIGLRIDHILCGSGWTPRWCQVGPDAGSAHLPVVAGLVESP